VDAYRFTRQFNFTALEPQGRMRGRISMGWKNSDFSGTLQGFGSTAIQSAGGAVAAPELAAEAPELTADQGAPKRQTLGPFAAAGDLTYRFTGSSLDFQPSWVATTSTYVKFSGHAIGGPSNVLFHVTSHDWQRSDRLFAAIMSNAGHPVGIIVAALVLAVITAGGDILQMTQALPGSVVNILMAVLLFVVLGRPQARA